MAVRGNHSLGGAARVVGFWLIAAAGLAAGLLLVVLIFYTSVALLAVVSRANILTVYLGIPLLMLLLFSAAATASGWLARRSQISKPWLASFLTGGFRVIAAAAGLVAGFLLAALIFAACFTVLLVAEPGGPTGLRVLWLILLLLLPFAGAAAASCWLARNSRTSKIWLASIVIGAAAFYAFLVLWALAPPGD
jgi:hypothetical protein